MAAASCRPAQQACLPLLALSCTASCRTNFTLRLRPFVAGLMDERDRLLVNPADMPLPAGATLIVVATSRKLLSRALKKPYSRLPAAEVERLTYLPQARQRGWGARGSSGCSSGSCLTMAEVRHSCTPPARVRLRWHGLPAGTMQSSLCALFTQQALP